MMRLAYPTGEAMSHVSDPPAAAVNAFVVLQVENRQSVVIFLSGNSASPYA
jgi:hypothetical protein